MTGPLDDVLAEVAFVLGLKVDAPLERVLEFLAGLKEGVDGFGVGHAGEVIGGEGFEAGAEAFIDKFFEDGEVAFVVVEDVFDEVAEEVFGEVHVALEVAEGDFGLDHPELGGVAGGVGIFRPEGGAEGVNF